MLTNSAPFFLALHSQLVQGGGAGGAAAVDGVVLGVGEAFPAFGQGGVEGRVDAGETADLRVVLAGAQVGEAGAGVLGAAAVPLVHACGPHADGVGAFGFERAEAAQAPGVLVDGVDGGFAAVLVFGDQELNGRGGGAGAVGDGVLAMAVPLGRQVCR
nr:hypothetical protein [Actinomadura sp. J1-007]